MVPEQRFIYRFPVSPLRMVVCGGFVVAAVFLGLAAIILRIKLLGWLAGASYVASCLTIQGSSQHPRA